MCHLRCFLRFALVVGIAGALLGGLTLLTNPRLPRAAAQAPLVVVVANTNDSGPGSLRQAILDVEPGGTILFDPGLAGGTIVLTSGQLVISQSLTIDASPVASLIVDGNRVDRVLYVAEGAAVEMIGLTVTGGQAPVNGVESSGHGGGILNLGELTLTGCNVSENRAGHGRSAQAPCPFVSATPGGDGGGIFNAGRLTVRATTVVSNTAGGGGGGLGQFCEPEPGASGGNGGGISSSGVLEVSDSAVYANRAGEGGWGFGPYAAPGDGGHGGGLHNTGILTVTNTSIVGNRAGDGYSPYWWSYAYYAGSRGGNGGGISSTATGRLALVDSILQDNVAGSGEATPDDQGRSGGGLYNEGVAMITGVLFESNRAGLLPEVPQGARNPGQGGNGGAIANRGMLVLRNSVLNGNVSGVGAHQGDSGGNGGGIWNHGAAHLIGSDIVDNMTGHGNDGVVGSFRISGTPGGDGGDGGGVWNDGSVVLLNVTVDGNQAGDGGLGGRTDLGAGLAGGNGGSGGGLWNGGQLLVYQATLSRNRAGAAGSGGDGASPRDTGGSGGQGGDGGGFLNQGSAALINSTVSGNTAGPGGAGGSAPVAGSGGDGGRGGGIYNGYSLVLDNVTLTANSAARAGQGGAGAVSGAAGVDGAGGGVFGLFAARDTILAGNSAPQHGPDCAGQLCAGSHNLLQNPAGCTVASAVTNNVIGRSPVLLPLALNAPGTTATHALFWGSAAIDAGGCSGGSVAHDQRSVPRPQGAGCDIGAYEFDGTTAGRLLWLPYMLRRGTP